MPRASSALNLLQQARQRRGRGGLIGRRSPGDEAIRTDQDSAGRQVVHCGKRPIGIGQFAAPDTVGSQAIAERPRRVDPGAACRPGEQDKRLAEEIQRGDPLPIPVQPDVRGPGAELTGLSTGGAITALIDRLERLGYARRQRDATDRRRVIVQATTEQAERELGPSFAVLDQAMSALIARYSDGEIAVMLDFLTRSNELMQAQIARVRADEAPRPRADS